MIGNQVNINRELIVNRRTASQQFIIFESQVEHIIETLSVEFKLMSFERLYSSFFKVFYGCLKGDLDVLKAMCIEYLGKRCVGVEYRIMTILNDTLLYFRRHCPEGDRVLKQLLIDSRKRSMTLMERCLNEIDKHPDIKKQLSKQHRQDIEYRIKKYYFV